MKLTDRQAEILEFIRTAIADNGMPPTRAEICAELGFASPNAAEDHLRALERKGAIELLPGASRGIVVKLHKPRGVPVVGRVAAGSPILAVEHIEEHYALDPKLFRPKADYFLRVRGMSMRDAGILDGDLLAVHASRTAESGQVVVARLGTEVTVKRLRRRGNRIRLLPENPDFEPIDVEPGREDFAIEGIGVGVLRHKVRL